MGFKIKLSLLIAVLVSFLFIAKNDVLANSCSCNVAGQISNNTCAPNTTATCSVRNGNNSVGYDCSCIGANGAAINSNDVFCGSSTSGSPKINTALGCVPVDMSEFIAWLLPWFFGVAGGISFFLMIFGFIKIATSEGDPKAVQGGKETITSAVTGLLLSVFSLFIIRLILLDILKIPGIN